MSTKPNLTDRQKAAIKHMRENPINFPPYAPNAHTDPERYPTFIANPTKRQVLDLLDEKGSVIMDITDGHGGHRILMMRRNGVAVGYTGAFERDSLSAHLPPDCLELLTVLGDKILSVQ